VVVPFAFVVVSIPLELVYFLLKHPINLDNRARVVVALFASFIMLCGITHSFNAARMDLIIRYLADHPGASDEEVHAYTPVAHWGMALLVSKVVTAIVSIITVMVLLLVVPQVIRMARLIPQLEEGLRTNIAELNEARAAAEAAMQRKSEFMAFLCHEIRNPVSRCFPAATMRSTDRIHTAVHNTQQRRRTFGSSLLTCFLCVWLLVNFFSFPSLVACLYTALTLRIQLRNVHVSQPDMCCLTSSSFSFCLPSVCVAFCS